MRLSIVLLAGFWGSTTLRAEPAGPIVPIAPKRTPAERAAALYRIEHGGADQATCAAPRGGEIIVCGDGRSPYRLPLPDERNARDGVRAATGEVRHVADAGSPMPGPRGVGVQLRAPLGRTGATSPAPPAVTGLGGR